VLALALAAQCGISTIDQGVPTLTGFIKTDLGVSAAVAGLVVSGIAFGKIFASYGAGIAADRLGERRVLVAGVFTAAVLVCAAAAGSPLPLFFGLLVAAGVASAASTPAGGRLVLNSFPRERHGLALGIRQTGIPLGGLVAAALLPWVAHTVGWRWALVAAAGVAALLVLPLAAARVDGGELELPVESARTPRRSALGRNVRLLTVWACLLVSGQFALIAFLALDFHEGGGLSLATASLLLVLANAVGIAARVGWGAGSDRLLARGRKPLLILLTAVSLGGALLLFAVPRSAPPAVIAVVAAIAGAGLIGYQGLWMTMLAEAAGPEHVGAATGFSLTFVTLSIAVSPPLYGLVADAAGTYRAIWGALALVLALAFVPAALVREVSERP
jgi:predicted MFS family arabinose efflux permease